MQLKHFSVLTSLECMESKRVSCIPCFVKLSILIHIFPYVAFHNAPSNEHNGASNLPVLMRLVTQRNP